MSGTPVIFNVAYTPYKLKKGSTEKENSQRFAIPYTAGVWSIVMGVFFAIAQKNEDKEKARKMIKNYVIGFVVIFAILVACLHLVKGIAVLIAG